MCYNAALAAVAKGGRWQEALALLVEMRNRFAEATTDPRHARDATECAFSSDERCYDVTTFNTVATA